MGKIGFTAALSILLLTAMLVTGCLSRKASNAVPSPSSKPVASPQPAAPANPRLTSDLPGDAIALNKALAEPSSVKYRLIIMDDTGGSDRTAFLDDWMQRNGQPQKDELLLMIFTKANYDIRFAMGAQFQGKISVDDLLTLIRTDYLPDARKDDPSGGLAKVIRALNKRMI